MGGLVHFGTDGWRERVDEGFDDENVVRVADAIGRVWSAVRGGSTVYVGYDTRAGAARFARLAGEVIASHGLTVAVSDAPCPTPALSWAVSHDDAACGGVMFTASHTRGAASRSGTSSLPTSRRFPALSMPAPSRGRASP